MALSYKDYQAHINKEVKIKKKSWSTMFAYDSLAYKWQKKPKSVLIHKKILTLFFL